MKIKNVFDLIFSMENLYGALEDASDQRRYNKDVMLFNFNVWDNLKEIRDSVYDGTYTHRQILYFLCVRTEEKDDNVHQI